MSRFRSSIWLILMLSAISGCATFTGEFQGEDEDGRLGRVIRVTHEGNDSVSAFILNRKIRYLIQNGFSKAPSKETYLQDAAAELEDYYFSMGFPEATVAFEVERPEESSMPILVRFQIQEGPRVRVTEIQITGNKSFKTEELLELWRRSHAGILGTGDPWFVEGEIRAFYRDIRAYYWSHGYLDAKVLKADIQRAKGSKVAKIQITLREGERYTIAEIQTPPSIERILRGKKPPIQSDEPASSSFIGSWRQQVLMMLGDMGYYSVVAAPVIQSKREGRRVFYKLPIRAGPKVWIGEITLEGNVDTRDQVILGKYRAKVGDLYQGSVEFEAIRRLYKTGLFKKVEFQHEELDEKRIRVTIKVEEYKNRLINLMVGWGSWERLRGGVQFRERNLFGTGLGFDAQGLVSTRGYELSSKLLDKDFFSTDVEVVIGVRYFNNERPSYTERALETDLSGTKYLFKDYKTRLGYLFKHQNKLVAKQDVTLPGEVITPNKGTLFLEILRDERDSILFPTEGWKAFARADYSSTALGGTQDFNRLILNGSYYLPLSKKSRIIFSGEIGAIWTGGDAPTVSISERLFNGGPNTVRSFQQDELGPKGPGRNPTGGLYRTVWKTELQFAILDPFQLALFADAGNVGLDVNDFGLQDMRYGIGSGLILNFPGVPIRLDAGFNPDRRPGEDEWVLHLTIGQTF